MGDEGLRSRVREGGRTVVAREVDPADREPQPTSGETTPGSVEIATVDGEPYGLLQSPDGRIQIHAGHQGQLSVLVDGEVVLTGPVDRATMAAGLRWLAHRAQTQRDQPAIQPVAPPVRSGQGSEPAHMTGPTAEEERILRMRSGAPLGNLERALAEARFAQVRATAALESMDDLAARLRLIEAEALAALVGDVGGADPAAKAHRTLHARAASLEDVGAPKTRRRTGRMRTGGSRRAAGLERTAEPEDQ